jgi:hypothetical protein
MPYCDFEDAERNHELMYVGHLFESEKARKLTSKERNPPIELPEGTQPWSHLDFRPERPM